MSINVLLADGLKEVGQVTKGKIEAALGYTPADEEVEGLVSEHIDDANKHITSSERALWNSKSDFSGAFTDLTNAPNITEDQSGELHIADNSGNVIARIDSNGIHATEVEAKGMMLGETLSQHKDDSTIHVTASEKQAWNDKSDFSGAYVDLDGRPNITEDSSGELVISDNNGNNILKVDENGLETTAVTAKTMIVNGMNIESTVNEHADDNIKHITSAERSTWNNKSDFSGNFADLQGAPNIVEDSSGELSINDLNGNSILKVNQDGLETTQVVAKAVIVNGANVESEINEHVDDSIRHITAAERTAWNAKATTNYVDQKVADLVNSAPEALNTLDELAAALGDDANFATTVTNAIAEKAKQSDFDQHKDDSVKHITATERTTWNNKSDFSGAYIDLIGAPRITENNSGDILITDENGNIIFRSDVNGMETTQVTAKAFILNNTDVEARLLDLEDCAAITNAQIDTLFA